MTLVELRKRLGLTQEQLAQKLGVSLTSVCNWENGRTEPRLSARKFNRMLQVYDCTWKELVIAIEESAALLYSRH